MVEPPCKLKNPIITQYTVELGRPRGTINLEVACNAPPNDNIRDIAQAYMGSSESGYSIAYWSMPCEVKWLTDSTMQIGDRIIQKVDSSWKVIFLFSLMERLAIWLPFVVKNRKSGIATVGSAGLSNVPTVGLYTHRDGRSGAILLAHSANMNAFESCSTVSCLDLAPRIGRPRSWFSFLNGRRKRIGISLTPREPVVFG